MTASRVVAVLALLVSLVACVSSTSTASGPDPVTQDEGHSVVSWCATGRHGVRIFLRRSGGSSVPESIAVIEDVMCR